MQFVAAEGGLNTSKAPSTTNEGSLICQNNLKLSVECSKNEAKYLEGDQDNCRGLGNKIRKLVDIYTLVNH